MNMAPDKRKSAEKIDDMTALLMAIGVSMTADAEPDVGAFFADPVVG